MEKHLKSLAVLLLFFIAAGCNRHPIKDKTRIMQIMQRVEQRNLADTFLTRDDERLMLDVIDYLMKDGSPNERMRAYYLLASVYRDLKDAALAVETFQKAAEQADTIDADCDYSLLKRIYGQKSDILMWQYLVDDAIIANRQSQHYALLDHDTCYMLDSELSILGMMYLLGQPDSLVHTAPKLLRKYWELGDTANSARRMMPAIFACLDIGDTEKAAYLFDIYERYSEEVITSSFESKNPHYYFAKGRIWLMQHKLDSAEWLLRKSFAYAQDWNSRQGLYRDMNKLFQETGRCDSSLKYAQLQCMAVDSDHQEKITLNLQRLESLYDYTLHKEEANRLAKEVEQKDTYRRKLILFFAMLGCVSVFIFILFRRQMQYRHLQDQGKLNTARIKLMEAESELEQSKLILSEFQKKWTKESRQQQLELELIHDELNRKQMLLTARQKEVEEITKALYVLSPAEYSDLAASNIVVQLRGCLHHENLPTEEQWSRLTALIMAVYPQFHKHIHEKLPGISERDIRVCMLIKLKLFSMIDISRLVNCHISTLTHIRTRLYTKAHQGEVVSAQEADLWIQTL